MASGALTFRKPVTTWLITAAAAALCLHGAAWFAAWSVFGDGGAWQETQRQMVLACFWIGCTLVMWKINLPPSRLHATLNVLTCALFVTVLGSAAALVKLLVVDRAAPTKDLMQTFALLSGLLLLAQLSLAVPTSILLQGTALTRKTGA